MLKNFRTYNLALQFALECQKLKHTGHLRDQLNRSSTSVVLNLAEGCSRSSKKDRARFYEIAFGSFLESRSILQLTYQACDTDAYLGASLYKLIAALRAG